MRKFLLAVMMLGGFAGVAGATAVHFSPPGNAVEVTDLLFDGIFYDVTFENGLFEDVFANRTFVDLGAALPFAAVDTLASALNGPPQAVSAGGDLIVFVPGKPPIDDLVSGIQLCAPGVQLPVDVWIGCAGFTVQTGPSELGTFTWVIFTPEVPEPSVLALIAAGIIAMFVAAPHRTVPPTKRRAR